MFCPECGKAVSDKARFCQFCGVDMLAFDAAAKVRTQEPAAAPPAENTKTPTKKGKKNSGKPLIAVPAVLAVIAAAFVFLWNGGEYWNKIKDFTGIGQGAPAGTPGFMSVVRQADENGKPPLDGQAETPEQENEDTPPETPVQANENTPPQPSEPGASEAPPPDVPLTEDGTLESAFRMAAAILLSDNDTPPADPWMNMTIHKTYLGDDGVCNFAATEADEDGKTRLLGLFYTDLIDNGGHLYAGPNSGGAGQSVWLSNGAGMPGDGHVTDSDYHTFGLIPNAGKADYAIYFSRPDKQPFTFNGIEIAAGVHDSEEHFHEYAQPTSVSLRILFADGSEESFSLPVEICAWGEAPVTAVLDRPLDNVSEIELLVEESSGDEEYIAMSEVSIY